jgi:hypothetical protein
MTPSESFPPEHPPCVYCGHDKTIDVTPTEMTALERWFECSDCFRRFAVRFTPQKKHAKQAKD